MFFFPVLHRYTIFSDNGFPLVLSQGCKGKWSNRSKHFLLHLQVTICKLERTQLMCKMTDWIILGMRAYVKKTLRTRKSQLNVIIWATGQLLVLPLGLFWKVWACRDFLMTWFVVWPVVPVRALKENGPIQKFLSIEECSDMSVLGLCPNYLELYVHIMWPISLLYPKHGIIQNVFYWFYNSHTSPSPLVKEWSIL